MVLEEACGGAQRGCYIQCSWSVRSKGRMIQDDAQEIGRNKTMEELIGLVDEFLGK